MAVAFFEAVRAAWATGASGDAGADDLEAAAADAWAHRAEREGLRRAVAAGVIDLAAYRRRPARRAGHPGAPPEVPGET